MRQYAIYDKTTGQEVQAFTFNSFFTGSGLPAATSNRGDPLVLYDQHAKRWLISDFAWNGSSGPSYLNIAVSKTSDPIQGGWWMYGYLHHQTYLNDYPKWGVWHALNHLKCNFTDVIASRIMLPKAYTKLERRVNCEDNNEFSIKT